MLVTPSLVGWWRFEGNANDSSGKGNNGTVYGASLDTGKFGRCYSFDGVDDYVDCGNKSSLDITDAITIEVWLRANDIITTNPDTGVVLKGPLIYGMTRDERSGSNNMLMTYINNGGNNLVTTIKLEEWQHIVFAYDKNLVSKQWKIYVNGNLKNQRDFTQSIGITTAALHIGENASQYFHGLIDEVRMYNRALSAAEISASYNATK